MTRPPTFAYWLKQWRTAIGLTQDGLAQRIPCSESLIRKLEAGKRRPSRQLVERLAEVLALPADQRVAFMELALFGEQPVPSLAVPAYPPSPSGWLPQPVTRLIGRTRDVAAVCAQLCAEPCRLLTLIGPPGIGKTRLAIQVAANLGSSFADGVWFVPLAPLGDAALVGEMIARTLGLSQVAGTESVDLLTEHLRSRQVLLVLDNCEHVLDAAPLVAELLERCGRLRVLATSRMPLRVRAEQRFIVAPLVVPAASAGAAVIARTPATALFVDRARAVHPGFSLGDGRAAAVAAICARLDGLPLAIELAANRSDTIAPDTLLRQLDHWPTVLTNGPRDLPARQQTMRDAIAWSYTLLPPDEQAAFARLGVFAGGCTQTAAVAVGAAHHLESLVAKSLVTQEGPPDEPRYVLLETLREYALEQLIARGDEPDALRCHAAYYLALAEQAEPEIFGSNQRVWLDRIENEIDNIRAALTWMLAADAIDLALRLSSSLYIFWYIRGSIPEGSQWMQAAITRARELNADGMPVPERSLAKALQWAGYMEFSSHHRLPLARALYEESIALHQHLDDPLGHAAALNGLGLVARMQGRPEEAGELHEQALRMFRAIGYNHGIARGTVNLGLVKFDMGHLDGAVDELRAGLALYRAIGDPNRVANTLSLLGLVLKYHGRLDEARQVYEEGLALHESIDSALGRAECAVGLGQVLSHQGLYQPALALLFQALQFYADRLGPDRAVGAIEAIALVECEHGHSERAVHLLALVDNIRGHIGLRHANPAAQREIDQALATLGRRMGAERFATIWQQGAAQSVREVVTEILSNDGLISYLNRFLQPPERHKTL
jgi:predicted ATPase/transcriptional regulator with XRE-family HTH domain